MAFMCTPILLLLLSHRCYLSPFHTLQPHRVEGVRSQVNELALREDLREACTQSYTLGAGGCAGKAQETLCSHLLDLSAQLGGDDGANISEHLLLVLRRERRCCEQPHHPEWLNQESARGTNLPLQRA